MNQSYFVMRPNKVTVFGGLLFNLFGITAFAWATYYFIVIGANSYEELILGGLLTIFLFIGSIGNMLIRVIWICSIQDNYIHYKSIVSNIKFTFDDIERVEVDIIHSHRSPELKTLHIYLYGRKRWISIPNKAVNSNAFIECLKHKNISGAENL